MLLREIVKAGRCAFFESAIDWKDAVALSCRPLVDTGCVTEEYAADVIRGVEKFGPYIVIIPGLAIPHSNEYPEHALKTAISFVNFQKPVIFHAGEEEQETQARLFFALSAVNADQHLDNMRRLFDVLSDETLLKALEAARIPQDLLELERRILS